MTLKTHKGSTNHGPPPAGIMPLRAFQHEIKAQKELSSSFLCNEPIIISKKIEMIKNITTVVKKILKLVILQNVVKCKKYTPMKCTNLVYFCIANEKLIPFSRM